MRHLEGDLIRRWHPNFGDDSKSVLPARYNMDSVTESQARDLEAAKEEYPEKSVSKILGCYVDNSGSLIPDFEDMEEKLWRAFFANAGSRDALRLPAKLRMA